MASGSVHCVVRGGVFAHSQARGAAEASFTSLYLQYVSDLAGHEAGDVCSPPGFVGLADVSDGDTPTGQYGDTADAAGYGGHLCDLQYGKDGMKIYVILHEEADGLSLMGAALDLETAEEVQEYLCNERGLPGDLAYIQTTELYGGSEVLTGSDLERVDG